MKMKVNFSEFWCVWIVNMWGFMTMLSEFSIFLILVLYCWEVWRRLMRGAPGLLLRGTGVAHEGGPPHEQVSRTDVASIELS